MTEDDKLMNEMQYDYDNNTPYGELDYDDNPYRQEE